MEGGSALACDRPCASSWPQLGCRRIGSPHQHRCRTLAGRQQSRPQWTAQPGRHRHAVQAQASSTTTQQSTAGKLRFIQHKEEAFWFYRFLSIVYDKVVNPGHWTEDMREDALSVAKLDSPSLKVRVAPGAVKTCVQC